MSKIKEIVAIADGMRQLADDLVALLGAPQVTPPQEPATFEPTMTLEELRAFVSARSSVENRPKIKAILDKFGVNKLTELDASQYAALKNEVALL